ncbi:hypothetical protein [Mesobacillus foraminis]|uniref:hypothetical protein n=1 Tax=Mesobacillus foraminis TaxID=279826 RepID=UPI000EF48CA7|nr:hypothetical protein [Mesobacillus foraminis]
MSNKNDSQQPEQPEKKMTLQEAIQKQLEKKKSQNSSGNANSFQSQTTKKMKSQQTKKVSNSRRKMGV